MSNLYRSITLFVFFHLVTAISVSAQVPTGYYTDAEGKSGDALKAALHDIIDDHQEREYGELRDFILPESDEDPDNPDNVILLYTGRSQSKSSFGGAANDWNREHVWAKSHGNFGNEPPSGTDAHHIRPTDASVNSDRGNKDFDNGGTENSEAKDNFSDSDSWEPRDEVKGDVARMMFYMATRYEGDSGELDLELVDFTDSSPGREPLLGKLSTLLEWHALDPVDDFERKRNEVIFKYQQNRNPFIDHPEYVNCIWSDNCSGEPIPLLITYTTDLSDFGNVMTGELSEVQSWELSGRNLTEEVSITVSTGFEIALDPTDFTSDITLDIADVNDMDTRIYVRFVPNSGLTGPQSGTMTLVSGDIEKSIALSGNELIAGLSLLSENFDNCSRGSTEGQSWTTYSVEGVQSWTCTTLAKQGNAISMNGYNRDIRDNDVNEDWLISPVLNIEGAATMTFHVSRAFVGQALNLKVSRNYSGLGNPTAAVWEDIAIDWPERDETLTFHEITVDLSSYTGSDIYVGFQYLSSPSTDGSRYIIDEIEILLSEKDIADIFLENMTQTYDGSAKAPTVSTIPAGLEVELTFDGSSELPLDAGSYAVVANVQSETFKATASGIFTILPAMATVQVDNTSQEFDGTPKPVTVTTQPEGLETRVLYDNSPTVPSAIGTYQVEVAVSDKNYEGSVMASLDIFTISGLQEAETYGIDISSSLAGTIFLTDTRNPALKKSIVLYHSSGLRIMKTSFTDKAQMNIPSGHRGIFLLLVQTSEGVVYRKIFIPRK